MTVIIVGLILLVVRAFFVLARACFISDDEE